MIILGIDPGLATTGYGIIEVDADKKPTLIDFGRIKTLKDHLMENRLQEIFNTTQSLVKRFSPDVMVVEKLFFSSNAKTAMNVGQARGICLLVGGMNKMPIFEYTALEAKKILTGYGKADKKDVKAVVIERLALKRDIKPIDASDALAIALCHLDKSGLIGDINNV